MMTAKLKNNLFDTGVEVISPLVEALNLELPANATSADFSADGTICAVAMGDGAVALLEVTGFDEVAQPMKLSPADIEVRSTKLHNVATVGVRSIANEFVSIGQDGRAVIFPADAPKNATSLYRFENAWIEDIAVSESSGLIALASGHRCVVVDQGGTPLADVDVGSTISAVQFDSTGKRIAASRYNGVTVVSSDTASSELQLNWKGSHTGVTWSRNDRYIVTATQERELHVWDLVTMQDFRIGGYPRKCHQMAWTADGDVLACSGADVVTAWSFAGSGPAGRPPVEIGFVFGGIVCAVCTHPTKPLVAGGFTTGNVLIGAPGKGEAVVAKASDGDPVTCLAWSPSGRVLAAGTRGGKLSLFRLADELNVR